MGQNEIKIFMVLVSIAILVFIIGIIIFIFQYREKRLQHIKETATLEESHKVDLLSNKLQTQQQTMQFIGREIHDSVTQKLTLAAIYTQQMEFSNQYPAMLHQLKGISNIINDSLAELRDLSKSLTENTIEHSGMTELLKQECDRVNGTSICRAILTASNTLQMSIMVKSFLLRIIQEFIQNSLKHANCKQINIELNNDEKGVYLIASDDGKGFDINAVKSNGIGLNNMRTRMQIIGGTFNFQSQLGKGSTLQLFVPNKQLSNSFN